MALTLNNFTGFETQGAEESAAVSGAPTYPTDDPAPGGSTAYLALDSTEQYDLPWVAAGVTDAGDDYIILFKIKAPDKIPTTSTVLLSVRDSAGGEILALQLFSGTGNVSVRDANNTPIRTITDPLSTTQYQIWEIHFQHSATGTVEVFIDGVSQGQDTSRDLTDGNSLNSSAVLRLQGPTGITSPIQFDDVHILSGAASAADRLGDGEVSGYQTGHTTDTDIGSALTTGEWDDTGDTPAVEESDANVASLAGASSTTADTDMDDPTIRGLGPGPKEIIGDLYFFDGSDSAANDPDGVWSNETNLDDGNFSNTATTTTNGTSTTNEVRIEGTNAPASGGTITNVYSRLRGTGTLDMTGNVDILTDGEGEDLGSTASPLFAADGPDAASLWITVTVPSGGWTWGKIQALETRIYITDRTAGTATLSGVEIFVEHSTGTERRNNDVSGTILGAKYIFRIKRTNGSGTSMGYRFGNDVDGITSSGNIESSLTTTYAIFEELSEAAGVVPTASEDFRIGLEAGTTDTGGRDILCSEAWAMLLHVPSGGHSAESAQTLANYLQAGQAHMHPDIAGAQALSDYLQTGSSIEIFIANAAQLLADYLQAGQAHMPPDVTGAQILSDYLQEGLPVQIFSASAVQTLADYLQSGTATSLETFSATGDQILTDYLQTGIGAHPHSGSGVQALVNFLQSGSAVQIFIATSAQSLPDFLQSGNGIMLPAGTGALTLAELQQAGVAVQIFTLAGDQTLLGYLQSGSASEIFTVAGDLTLAELQQAGVAVMIPASTGVQVLADFLQAATALQTFTLAGDQTLENYLQAGVVFMHPDGTGVLILPDYLQTGDLTHSQTITLSAAQALANYLQTGSLNHSQNIATSGAQTLNDYLQSGSVHMVPTAVGTQTLAAFLQTASASEVFTVAGSQLLFDYLQSGDALMIPSATGALTLAQVTQAATGQIQFIAASTQVLAQFIQAGDGVVFPSGIGAQTIAELLQVASGSEIIIASGSSVLPDIIQNGIAVMAPVGAGASILSDYAQAGIGVEIFISAGNQTLSNLTQSGNGGISFDGISAQALADFVQNGNGAQVFIGAAAQTLAALAQAGTGVVVLAGPLFVAEFIALLDNPDISVQSFPEIVLPDVGNVILSTGGNTGV